MSYEMEDFRAIKVELQAYVPAFFNLNKINNEKQWPFLEELTVSPWPWAPTIGKARGCGQKPPRGVASHGPHLSVMCALPSVVVFFVSSDHPTSFHKPPV
jgi:hypothetical protein